MKFGSRKLHVFFCSFAFGCCLLQAQEKIQSLLPGLQSPAEVIRDQWGMNHIYAQTQHDLFFTQGYCAAKDRLFQFEIWRRQATGTVAELLGSNEVKRDIGTRLFLFRGDMNKELAHYHPDGAAIIGAYVDGVNAYIDEVLANPALLPMEFKLLHLKPGKWTPAVVISRHQGLLGNIEEELETGQAVALAGEKKVKDLMWFHPKEPNLVLDKTIIASLLSKNILDLYKASHQPVVFSNSKIPETSFQPNRLASEKGAEGSNNWVVSGTKTASGFPILANDPHRSISLPSLRYMVHLNAPGWNVIGAGEPVIPGVSIGHNDYGAWGLTIFETDGEDLYVYDVNPANLAQYRYKTEWVAMKEIRDTIAVKDAPPVAVSLRYTVHGPVTYIDTANLKAYAIKCAWLEPGGAPYLSSLRIDQAKTWEDFRNATTYSHIPAENMIWADRKGNIGWQVVGITPIRKNFSGMVPVPGDGRFEWDGYQKINERPHVLNPKKGFFATANQNVTPPDYPYWNTIGYTWADSFRGDRINEVLSSDNKLTIEKTKALQTDYTSIPARTLVPMLKKIPFSASLPAKAKSELVNWNYVLSKESVAAGIYAMWERTLKAEANEKFVPQQLQGLVTIQLQKLIRWLQRPDGRFGPDPFKGRDSFLKQSFEKAMAALQAKLGNSFSDWVYGQSRYKHTALNHPLTIFFTNGEKEKYNLGSLPRGGNAQTVNSTGDGDTQAYGASFRLITSLDNWNKTLMINTPGQSGNPASEFYKNLFPLWANDQYFPAYFTKEKIQSVADEILLLQPKK